MKLRSILGLTLLGITLLPAAAFVAPSLTEPLSPTTLDLTIGDRTCGTPRPTAAEMTLVERARRQLRDEQPLHDLQVGGKIRVAFHVLTAGKVGNVTDTQIVDQIAELNRAYAGSGYEFELASVDRTNNAGWCHMYLLAGTERRAKQALAVDPAHTLNIYSGALPARLLGWAYYPWSFPEDYYLHGVVIHYGTLPGGYLSRYNLGRTAVHEVGHYLGLLHTFENGCEAPGDFVDDTPFEAGPAFGCPEGLDTCPDPGLDPIHNYMDYTDDPCITEFTAGQVAFSHEVVPVYRPSLLGTRLIASGRASEIAGEAANPADLGHGLEFRGAGPNPFRLETAIRFVIPRADRVSLQVFNVAGQRVRSVIDAQLPAGAHSAMFSGRGLPAGLYFLRLQVGSAQMTRSAILLR